MGSQLYRCFSCDSEPFRAGVNGPSCPKCESPDAVASISEIHMIFAVKGGPINGKYRPLCCNTRPLYFTNSEGGVTCPTCLKIIERLETEKAEGAERAPDPAASEQTPPVDATVEPAPLAEPQSIQEPAPLDVPEPVETGPTKRPGHHLEQSDPDCPDC